MTDCEKTVMNWLAEDGEYYDSVDEIPADILEGKVRSMERILSAPDDFPRADIPAIEAVYPAFVGVCAGRLLFF